MELWLYLILAAALGFAFGFMLSRLLKKDDGRTLELEKEKAALTAQHAVLKDQFVQMQDQMRWQFENLAGRIFEEQSSKFQAQSQQDLGTLLNPLKEKLAEFQTKVDTSFGEQAKEQFALKNEIERIVKLNQQMGQQTENLTRALKGDVKAQGNWGEVMLERILEASGLRPGVDYTAQASEMGLRSADGAVQKPDVIVHLPENKHIIIDAKVSLTHYERMVSEPDEAARALHQRQFLESLRAHVRGLSDKRYDHLTQLGTPDFVLMFLPIEGAYAFAVQQDAGLHAFAWERKIVLTCPSTLFATLKTIASLWRMELQNQNALKIAQESGLLYDKFVGFVGDMEQIGKQIERTHTVYQDAFSKLKTGKGNLIRKVELLRQMGAKAEKTLPAALLVAAKEEEEAA